MSLKVTIEELGGRGDGIVKAEKGPIYVPFSVPGDVVDLDIQGRKGSINRFYEKSSHRVEPPCQYFMRCGGCAVQHIEDKYYRHWKTDLIRTALKNQDLTDIQFAELQVSSINSRRRTSFHALGLGARKIKLGYAQKGSHNLIDINMCSIIVPEIEQFIDPLRVFLTGYLKQKQKMTIAVTASDNGLDVILNGAGEPDLDLRMKAATFAEKNDLARISWLDTKIKKSYFELLAERKKPFVTFNGRRVYYPIGSFLQATKEGQDILIKNMLESLPGCKKILDLFSGCGTFSVAAASECHVHAVENNQDMLNALKSSVNMMSGIKNLTTEVRDLFFRPLLPHELNEFDAAIIDPPRAGAHNQISEIIKSDLQKLVMISCNPVTFAKDSRRLVEAGFTMGIVTPVDQFLFSSHLEIITVFTR